MFAKFRPVLLAATASTLLATAGCTTTGATTEAAPHQSLQGVQKIGRCHMGGCSWFRVENFAMIRETPQDALLRVNVRWGSSMHPDGNMPDDDSRNVAIEWQPEIEESYVFCTPRFPALIQKDENGRWQAARMDLVSTAGAMESAASLYGAVCHPDEDWRSEEFVRRHGYRSVEDGNFFIDLDRPEDILTRAQ